MSIKVSTYASLLTYKSLHVLIYPIWAFHFLFYGNNSKIDFYFLFPGLCTLEGMHEVLSSRDLDDLHPLKGYTGTKISNINKNINENDTC